MIVLSCALSVFEAPRMRSLLFFLSKGMGTVAYTAPERFSNAKTKAFSDVAR